MRNEAQEGDIIANMGAGRLGPRVSLIEHPGELARQPRYEPTTLERRAERVLAMTLILMMPITKGLSVRTTALTGGIALAIVVLPVTAVHLRRFTWALQVGAWWMVSLLTAPLWVVLAIGPDRVFDQKTALSTGIQFAAGLLTLITILWARSVLPVRLIAVCFATGALAQALLTETAWAGNGWKYALSWPVMVIALALAKSRTMSLVVLAAGGVISALRDTRSVVLFCAITGILVMLGSRRPARTAGTRRALGMVSLIAAALGLYQGGEYLALHGQLGADVQLKTERQVALSPTHSLLGSTRPEWSATSILVGRRPIGFGPGVTPNREERDSAQAALGSQTGTNVTDYSNDYLFAKRVELHSILADLWATWSIPGFILGLLIVRALIRSMIAANRRRHASPLILFVGIYAIWDMAFSPIGSNLFQVVLALALLLPPRGSPAPWVRSYIPRRGITLERVTS